VETSLSWLNRLTSAPTEGDWKQLFDVYRPLLCNWLARAGVPAIDRDDLIQEVLVVIVRRVGEFDRRGSGAFRAWLRSILTNYLRKYFRDRRPLDPAIDLDELAADDSILGRRWDREHDEYLATRALRQVEGDFAAATWAAFRRQVLDGCPPSAVAAELGLSLNAVILAKSRVLKRLREELRGLVE
jgi:RNA polymerase sigma-70 factor (ECF subfamily)